MGSEKKDFDAVAELAKLAQFQFIDERQLQKWVDRVMEIDPERIEWHVRRLSGIGGSEIGVLVGALRNYYHPHSSAPHVVGSKLLEVLPEEPNGDMLRGTTLEPVARDIYRKQILKTYPLAKPRDDIMDDLQTFRDEERPWLIGTPDEVMELEPGKIWIIDYKCPTPAALAEYAISGVPFYYAAQLHHYTTIAQKMGYEIAGLQLASLDMKNWNMDLRDVPYEKSFADECLHAGDYYWNEFVMKGVVPPMGKVKRYGDAEDVHDNLREAAVSYSLWKTLGNFAIKQGDLVGQRIRESGITMDASVDSINIGITDIKAERTLDVEAMAHALNTEDGIDTKPLRKEGSWDIAKLLTEVIRANGITDADDPRLDAFRNVGEFDQKLVLDAFRRIGKDISPYVLDEEIKLVLAKGKNEYAATVSGAMKDAASEGAYALVDQMRDRVIEAEGAFNEALMEKSRAKRSKKAAP